MPSAFASPLRSLTLALVLGAGLTTWGACDNDARDSHCAPESEDPRCLFESDGRGPGNVEGRCAMPTEGSGECPDFGAVMAFMSDPERGNCAAVGCHGSQGTAAIGIYFPLGDACETYRALYNTRGSIGRPYLQPDDPATPDLDEAMDSWMYCNVLGLEGGGFPMPKPGGVHDPQTADVIRDFILCGAPAPCDVTGSGT